MKIYKFGGASIRDANAVKNLAAIVSKTDLPLIIVVSAMGKTTNALEALLETYLAGPGAENQALLQEQLAALRDYHTQTTRALFPQPTHKVHAAAEHWFGQLHEKLQSPPCGNYDYEYDQIIPYGEYLSTTIVGNYLEGLPGQTLWTDIRHVLRTDSQYRNANIDWEGAVRLVKAKFSRRARYITQGFVGGNALGETTTLGREGSDFTAAILGHILNVKEVTIWKDVAGVFNADPARFDDAVKLERISFHEAVELAYFGAKVIHPKTIKPLQNKGIPLRVKSFVHPKDSGTRIDNESQYPLQDASGGTPPVFILKENQWLISVSPKDFSFIVEKNLSKIFGLFSKHQVSINLMQHGAISFSVCVDAAPRRLPALLDELRTDFQVAYNKGLTLLTIRHYTPAAIERMTHGKNIYVQQLSRKTARFVLS